MPLEVHIRTLTKDGRNTEEILRFQLDLTSDSKVGTTMNIQQNIYC